MDLIALRFGKVKEFYPNSIKGLVFRVLATVNNHARTCDGLTPAVVAGEREPKLYQLKFLHGSFGVELQTQRTNPESFRLWNSGSISANEHPNRRFCFSGHRKKPYLPTPGPDKNTLTYHGESSTTRGGCQMALSFSAVASKGLPPIMKP